MNQLEQDRQARAEDLGEAASASGPVAVIAMPIAQAAAPPDRTSYQGRKLSTSDFKVGATAPLFQVEIINIIFVTEAFVVFLDAKLETYWWATGEHANARKQGFRAVLNRVAELEAVPIAVLKPEQIRAFRTLVAEGVARALDEDDVSSAQAVHDKAERYVNARLSEMSRAWYLEVALFGAALLGIAMGALAILRSMGSVSGDAPDVALSILGGALGSAFSLMMRAGGLSLDPGAGYRLHVCEAMARLMSGALSGMLVILLVSSGQFIPMLKDANLATMVLLCIVSGVSERFVPSLISQLENTVVQAATPKKEEK